MTAIMTGASMSGILNFVAGSILALAVQTGAPDKQLAVLADPDIAERVASWTDDQVAGKLRSTVNSAAVEDIYLNRALLRAARERHLHDLADTLRRFLAGATPSSRPYTKEVDPHRAIEYHVRATLLSFELDKQGLVSLGDRTGTLLSAVQTKLEQPGQVVNAELILLEDRATELTDMLLGLVDMSDRQRIRELALLVLRASRDPRLERHLLVHARAMSGNGDPLYPHVCGTLGAVGGYETLAYFESLLTGGQPSQRRLGLGELEYMFRNGANPDVRAAAQAILAREEPD
jgi:hypothetical protein